MGRDVVLIYGQRWTTLSWLPGKENAGDVPVGEGPGPAAEGVSSVCMTLSHVTTWDRKGVWEESGCPPREEGNIPHSVLCENPHQEATCHPKSQPLGSPCSL